MLLYTSELWSGMQSISKARAVLMYKLNRVLSVKRIDTMRNDDIKNTCGVKNGC